MKRIILRIIVFIATFLDAPYNWLLSKIKKIEIGKDVVIRGKLMVTGSGKLVLGNNVSINSSRRSNHIGDATRTIFKLKNPDSLVEIGEYTGISNATFVCREHIKIGRHVKIGGGVKFYDSDAHSLNYEDRMDPKKDIAAKRPIVVKDHAFIGAYSFILKGVTIGEKSIIGAGSVVTKSVPDGEIWGGNPAKFIKKIA